MKTLASGEYIPKMDHIIYHWTNNDPALSLKEKDEPFTLADFEALRTTLDESHTESRGLENDLDETRTRLEIIRDKTCKRLTEFNLRMRAEFADIPEIAPLPKVPNRTNSRNGYLKAMDTAIIAWNKVNDLPVSPTYTPPLLLREGFSLADFETLRGEVDTSFTDRHKRDTAVSDSCKARQTLQERAYTLMKQYRLKVKAYHEEGSNPVVSLPRITPPKKKPKKD